MLVYRFKIWFTLFCCILQGVAIAQICNGSLGDPVVNITFGKGSNPGPALSATLPNLSYTANFCPEDGFYTIGNSSSGCFGNTWHAVSANHTASDPNGYMMVINASFNSGDFYVDTVKGLCGGTTYEFAGWVLNVLKTTACGSAGINPNLIFNIESTSGTVLGTYKTGNIPQSDNPVWKQYGLFFTTPAAASNIVLRITNTAPGGCGNDIILDDITFRPCGPTVKAGIAGSSATSVDQCVYNAVPIPLQANIGAGYNSPSYRWQSSTNGGSTWVDIAGATTSFYTHQPAGAGVFKYRLTVAESGNIGIKECRVASNEITITIHEQPGKGTSSNSPVCINDLVELKGGAGNQFAWKGPNGFSSTAQNPSFIATQATAGWYYLKAGDAFGCSGTDSVLLIVKERPVAQAADSVGVCEGVPIVLTASGGTTYLWSPSTGLSAINIPSPTATLTNTVTYTISVGNDASCKDTAVMKVNVIKAPKADAGSDKFIFEGQAVTLQGKIAGTNIDWEWLPVYRMTNSNSLNPKVNPSSDFTYRLQVQSNAGCGTASDDVFVRVFKKVIVPTAFSPNGDGVNDTWRIQALITYPENEVSVFDRYGQNVFRSQGYTTAWDGTKNEKPVPVGTYYYIIDLKNNLPVLQGWVYVTR